jgi:hypothetical protein
MKLRELTTTEANPLDAMKTGAQKAAGAVKAAAGKVAQKGADAAVGAVANATGASKDDVKSAAQQQGGIAGKVAGMASGADPKAQQKTAQGAKMAGAAMGAKGGSGAMMAKGLDKLASGGALQGNLAKQIAPFAKQLTTILGDQAMRQKFMMLVKQAEKGAAKQAAAPESSNYTPTKDKDDYNAKSKAIQDLQADPNTSKDPELKKELMKRKASLEKDKPVDEADHIMQLAKLVSGASNTQQNQASDFANEMKALAGIKEVATAGATSAGNIASVANPLQAYGHRPKDEKGLPKAPQKKKADGTAVNALDMGNNLMGGTTVKRN